MILRRTHYRDDGVFGELYDDKNNLICFTLEHSYNGTAKIPLGTYRCEFEFSWRFQRKLWELKDVPNATECKFHSGNKEDDSEGCILVGLVQDLNNGTIYKSRAALTALHKSLEGHTSTTLIVDDAIA